MGTPDFSVPALKTLIDHQDNEIIAVYTQPPRPKGRGQKIQKSPIYELADTHNIPVYTPKSLKKDKEAVEVFKSHNADIAIVAAYGLILPQTVLDAPKYGCLNIHASLLPRWRGAAPIQYAIWKGDTKSGITIMQMDVGLDTGDMISKQECDITADTDIKSLHDTLSDMGSSMLPPLLDIIRNAESLTGEKQDDSKSNYASMLSKQDGEINWNNSAIEIHCQIRALKAYSGKIKIISAQLTDQVSDDPIGTIIDKKGNIACGDGSVLKLKIVQPVNKRPMDFTSAINGNYLTVETIIYLS
jgi:methionyl-tRNA formyltransferase